MHSAEKARATICMLGSQHAFESAWDGTELTDEQIEAQAQIYAKAYREAAKVLRNNENLVGSMKFDYNFAGFDSAYRYIRDDVVKAVL
ncbi:MAG TPA: hypothetical protein VHV10_08820 [Ktedonobacteraceae bacterium]|nr:hypothetical protein [Ktedonobacteraceae bacterium]